jgi:hypothetical protein
VANTNQWRSLSLFLLGGAFAVVSWFARSREASLDPDGRFPLTFLFLVLALIAIVGAATLLIIAPEPEEGIGAPGSRDHP